MSVDVVLRGGEVVDGSGAEPTRADVAIQDGRVVEVGVLPEIESADEVDVTGRYVLPGFVDAHVHVDAAAVQPEVQRAALRQGVTTWILGQDGVSFAPSTGETAHWVDRYFGAINGPAPSALSGGCTVSELLASYDRSIAVNVGYLVPAGTVRAEVMGLADRPPSDDDVVAMQRLVEAGMSEGALGLSTGLDYVPGRFADAAEMAALCRPFTGEGVYVTHMRGYGDTAPVGIAEVREIVAQSGGVAAHISHFHGPPDLLAGLVDQALADGIDLSFDAYPYTRGNTIVAMLMLPAWVQDEGIDTTVERLGEPSIRKRLQDEWFPTVAARYPLLTLSFVDAEEWKWAEGVALPEAADRAGMSVEDFLCTILADASLNVAGVMTQPRSSDAGLRALMKHDRHMGGSDGIPLGGQPHPRFWGTFARLLGYHTRELGDLTWGQAAAHLSGYPSARFGLGRRGQIRAGYVADLCVVDPQRVIDTATYDHPRRLAVGVDDVLVGGVWALRQGELTGATPGRGLKWGADV